MQKRPTMVSALSLLVFMHSALAAATPPPICGDWDLGPNSSALRISTKDPQSVFVEYCDRATLLGEHMCDANVILYFEYSDASQEYVHGYSGVDHLYATLKVDPRDPTKLKYTFRSDVGGGAFIGSKIALPPSN